MVWLSGLGKTNQTGQPRGTADQCFFSRLPTASIIAFSSGNLPVLSFE